MQSKNIEDLKYPIGKFQMAISLEQSEINEWITIIEQFPKSLNKIIPYLSSEELLYRYRPEGWTIKQVIHHCADSHMNSFMRFKLALTEDVPTIKPYEQGAWAQLPDARDYEIAPSMLLLKGLHARWGILLRALTPEDLNKTYIHPEKNKPLNLADTIGLYAWHCKHHLAHIRQALERQEP